MAVNVIEPPASRSLGEPVNPLNPVLWLIEAMWQYVWLMVTVVLAGIIAAAVLADRLPNTYTASGLVEIDPSPNDVLRDRETTGFIPPETITETEVQVIRSYAVLSRVVEELDLAHTEANPLLKAIDFAGPSSRESVRSAIVSALAEDLTVAPTGRSFVVEVGYEGRDPEFVAAVVNAVMGQYLGVDVSEQRSQTSEAITQLSERLTELRRDLDGREHAVQMFRSEGRIQEGAGTDMLSAQLARLNEELIKAQASFASAAAMSGQRDGVDGASGGDEALPQVVASPLIQELRAQGAVQQRAVSELEALYRPSHPRLAQARGALAAVNDLIAEETNKIARSLGASELVEERRVAALQGQVNILRDRLNEQRSAEIELRRFEREVEASRKIYEAFLDRFNEVQGSAGLERPEGRIVAQAVAPVRPSGPNRVLVLAGGGVLSGSFAFALVIALALLDKRLRTRGDVARAVGLTPVATVPPPPKSARGLIGAAAGKRRNMQFAEAITQLRAALVLTHSGRGPAIVAVTATDDAVGHVALATALAQASAIAGDATVLLDANFARPAIHGLLGGGNEYGLADVVADRGDLLGALLKDPASGAMYLPAGRRTDPALYRSTMMDDVLDDLYEQFDVIVIALPALLEQPDAQSLVAEADVTAVAVRSGVTDRASLSELVGMLRFSGPDVRLATVLVRG